MILLIKEHALIHSWADLLHFFCSVVSLVQVLCVFDGVASFVWQGLFCLTWLDFEYFNSYLRLTYCQLLKAYKIYNNNTTENGRRKILSNIYFFMCLKMLEKKSRGLITSRNSTKCLHIWLKLLVIMICSWSSHVCE